MYAPAFTAASMSACVEYVACSISRQPARAAAPVCERYACTMSAARRAAASSQSTRSCSSVIVGPAPTRSLFDAKILMRSAPCSLRRRTIARSESLGPMVSA